MARPVFYRDPVHAQLSYPKADLSADYSSLATEEERFGWLLRTLIDSPEMQRLRHIRQLGPANLVFHGAEHSRFSHSMGVAHVARHMYDNICRNVGDAPDERARLATCAAALLHDVGHGPFSHTLEEILRNLEVVFDHEEMSKRIILEEESTVAGILRDVDSEFPKEVAAYVDKKMRTDDHWTYKVVSSQLDADRLDYLLRDAQFTGLVGHGFDLPRILDFLCHVDGKRIAVDERAMVSVEGYLVALDQAYRAVYYHHTIRAASVLIGAVLHRALSLAKDGDNQVLPNESDGQPHPLTALLTTGDTVTLQDYCRLGEYHIWALVEAWQRHDDKVLADLACRLIRRHLFKTVGFTTTKFAEANELTDYAKQLTKEAIAGLDDSTVKFYMHTDQPSRTSYKLYDWRAEGPDESIFIVGDATRPTQIEEYKDSEIVSALKRTLYFPRLVVVPEIREKVIEKGRALGVLV